MLENFTLWNFVAICVGLSRMRTRTRRRILPWTYIMLLPSWWRFQFTSFLCVDRLLLPTRTKSVWSSYIDFQVLRLCPGPFLGCLQFKYLFFVLCVFSVCVCAYFCFYFTRLCNLDSRLCVLMHTPYSGANQIKFHFISVITLKNGDPPGSSDRWNRCLWEVPSEEPTPI